MQQVSLLLQVGSMAMEIRIDLRLASTY